MEDINILALYWARDEAALKETELKYGKNCRRISFRIVNNREDCEECVNDTYLAAWNSIPPKRPGSLCAYLYKIVRNFSIARIRAANSQKRGGGEIELVLDELKECIASNSNVEREAELKELEEAIRSFVLKLNNDDRIIFTARYWLAAPIKEISEKLNMKPAKINSSLYRSRQKLHDYLCKEGFI